MSDFDDLELFLESLKVLNFNGRLEKNTIVSVSCSGGEASLVSDLSKNMSLKFPKFSKEKSGKISFPSIQYFCLLLFF